MSPPAIGTGGSVLVSLTPDIGEAGWAECLGFGIESFAKSRRVYAHDGIASFFLNPCRSASAQTGQKLDIYLVDVEGGNAVLFVSPTLESLLMDTGNVGAVAAPRDAG